MIYVAIVCILVIMGCIIRCTLVRIIYVYHLSVPDTWRVRPSSMIFMFKSSPVYSGATAISAGVCRVSAHLCRRVPCQC
jgi:hypothetical protein